MDTIKDTLEEVKKILLKRMETYYTKHPEEIVEAWGSIEEFEEVIKNG